MHSYLTAVTINANMMYSLVWYANRQDLYSDQIVDLTYMHTNENLANILTQTLIKDKLEKFIIIMGLR